MKRFAVVVLLAAIAGEASPADAQVVVQGGAEIRPNPGYQPSPRRFRRRPGPRLMAPLRIDLGWIGAPSDHGFLSGAEISVGVHWASLSPTPTSFDIGLGVFGGAMTNQRLEDADEDPISYGGAYFELGKTLSGGEFWRTWASGRAEYFGSQAFGDERRGLGASGKLEVELYVSGVGIAPSGIFLGTYAIGLYVEAALRRLDDDVNVGQFGLGLTIRTPLVWSW